uniref:28 kDa Metastriate family member n=1 Tax=Rhipicephalus zambeziensis TaxID=60191 RepID=A0A224Y0X1_9ACAR
MNPASLLLLNLFIVASIVSAAAQHNILKSLPPVGEGVEIHVQVLYDDTVNASSGANIFRQLFKKVQGYFNNESIMIKFKVENMTKNNSLRAFYKNSSSLDAIRTLANLTKYATQEAKRNDTVFYYFSEKEILQETRTGDLLELDLTEKATIKTLCTSNSSAVLVKYIPDSEDRHIPAVKGTAEVMGLRNYKKMTLSEYISLLRTFWKCPKSDCWMQCLKQDDATSGE